MNILIYTDLHIEKKELQECKAVLDEIKSLCVKHNVKQIINLGDTFDKVNPESECLDLFAKFIQEVNIPMIILAANSHESTTPEESVLNHYGILNKNVSIVKSYKDEKYMFCGHFTLQESKLHYGSKISKDIFRDYKYVFLGHQHSYQLIKPNICHLGSVRYVDFAEVEDKNKVVCLIENYRTDKEKVHFLALKSLNPMKDIVLELNQSKNASPEPNSSLDSKLKGKDMQSTEKSLPESSSKKSQGENRLYASSLEQFFKLTDSLTENTKVRVIFKNFYSYSEAVNYLDKFRDKFVLFREKKDYTISVSNQESIVKETISLKSALLKYIKDNNIDNDIKNILIEEL